MHSGQFVSNFIYDATLMREAFTQGVAALGWAVLSLIFLSGVLVYQNCDWQIAVVVLPFRVAARKLGGSCATPRRVA